MLRCIHGRLEACGAFLPRHLPCASWWAVPCAVPWCSRAPGAQLLPHCAAGGCSAFTGALLRVHWVQVRQDAFTGALGTQRLPCAPGVGCVGSMAATWPGATEAPPPRERSAPPACVCGSVEGRRAQLRVCSRSTTECRTSCRVCFMCPGDIDRSAVWFVWGCVRAYRMC